jgi:hypothetical protein
MLSTMTNNEQEATGCRAIWKLDASSRTYRCSAALVFDSSVCRGIANFVGAPEVRICARDSRDSRFDHLQFTIR